MQTSTVDNILARYGLAWVAQPYRILDISTGQVVSKGPYFDLTDISLQKLRNRLDTRFKKSL